MEVRIFDNKQSLAENFAGLLIELCGERPAIHIALSGGSTPKGIFEVLASRFSREIPWERVWFYWGDERCVPPTHPESNFRMAQESLLLPLEILPSRIFRMQGENEPEAEAERYADILDAQLPKFHGIPQFDLVMLGLGEDGHTVSIFPDQQLALWNSSQLCEVALHPESGQKRITITGRAINNAACLTFLVTGGSKARILKELLEEDEPEEGYPASRVEPSHGQLIWFLDRAAAARLTSGGS